MQLSSIELRHKQPWQWLQDSTFLSSSEISVPKNDGQSKYL